MNLNKIVLALGIISLVLLIATVSIIETKIESKELELTRKQIEKAWDLDEEEMMRCAIMDLGTECIKEVLENGSG